MTRKLRAVIPAILCVALAASACSKKEETPTFTGDKTEEPSYQANLDFVTPAAYSNIQGLNLEPGTYISIIGKDENSSYWKEVKKGVEQAVKDLNKTLGYSGEDKIKATFNAPDGEDIDEQVNILDDTPPDIKDSIIEDGVLSFRLEDTQSGVNYDTIYAYDDDTPEILPLSIDRSTGIITFDMQKENLTICVKDQVGNEARVTITPKGENLNPEEAAALASQEAAQDGDAASGESKEDQTGLESAE